METVVVVDLSMSSVRFYLTFHMLRYRDVCSLFLGHDRENNVGVEGKKYFKS